MFRDRFDHISLVLALCGRYLLASTAGAFSTAMAVYLGGEFWMPVAVLLFTTWAVLVSWLVLQ